MLQFMAAVVIMIWNWNCNPSRKGWIALLALRPCFCASKATWGSYCEISTALANRVEYLTLQQPTTSLAALPSVGGSDGLSRVLMEAARKHARALNCWI